MAATATEILGNGIGRHTAVKAGTREVLFRCSGCGMPYFEKADFIEGKINDAGEFVGHCGNCGRQAKMSAIDVVMQLPAATNVKPINPAPKPTNGKGKKVMTNAATETAAEVTPRVDPTEVKAKRGGKVKLAVVGGPAVEAGAGDTVQTVSEAPKKARKAAAPKAERKEGDPHVDRATGVQARNKAAQQVAGAIAALSDEYRSGYELLAADPNADAFEKEVARRRMRMLARYAKDVAGILADTSKATD